MDSQVAMFLVCCDRLRTVGRGPLMVRSWERKNNAENERHAELKEKRAQRLCARDQTNSSHATHSVQIPILNAPRDPTTLGRNESDKLLTR